jgi:GNAT superfamily N-acetyltransferase
MTTAEIYSPSDHHDNPYALADEKLHELTNRLLAERPPQGDDRFVCYKLEGDDVFAGIGRKIESDVFREAFNNSPEQMEAVYGPYEEQSMFFVTVDREKGVPTGAMRIVKDGPAGFISFNDFLEKHPDVSEEQVREFHGMHDDARTWDVATVAVPPEYRDKGTATQLYRAMYKTAVDDGIEHVVAIIDADPLKKMNKFLGIPLVPMIDSKPFPYIGSQESQAVYGRISEFNEVMTKHRKRSLRGFLAREAIHRLLGQSDDSNKGLQF